MACRYFLSWTYPAAKTPLTVVSVVPCFVTTYPSTSSFNCPPKIPLPDHAWNLQIPSTPLGFSDSPVQYSAWSSKPEKCSSGELRKLLIRTWPDDSPPPSSSHHLRSPLAACPDRGCCERRAGRINPAVPVLIGASEVKASGDGASGDRVVFSSVEILKGVDEKSTLLTVSEMIVVPKRTDWIRHENCLREYREVLEVGGGGACPRGDFVGYATLEELESAWASL